MKVQCDCSQLFSVHTHALTSGHTTQCLPCARKRFRPLNINGGFTAARRAKKNVVERIVMRPGGNPDQIADQVAKDFDVRRTRLLDRMEGRSTTVIYEARDELVLRLRETGMTGQAVADFLGRSRVAITMASGRAAKRRQRSLDTSTTA